jgi:hypothetical protein
MHEATRLPRDVRIRLVYQGILTAAVTLVLLGGGGWLLWTFTLYVNDMRQQIREEMRSHRAIQTTQTTAVLEGRQAFAQMLADHRAQMRAMQEGR